MDCMMTQETARTQPVKWVTRCDGMWHRARRITCATGWWCPDHHHLRVVHGWRALFRTAAPSKSLFLWQFWWLWQGQLVAEQNGVQFLNGAHSGLCSQSMLREMRRTHCAASVSLGGLFGLFLSGVHGLQLPSVGGKGEALQALPPKRRFYKSNPQHARGLQLRQLGSGWRRAGVPRQRWWRRGNRIRAHLWRQRVRHVKVAVRRARGVAGSVAVHLQRRLLRGCRLGQHPQSRDISEAKGRDEDRALWAWGPDGVRLCCVRGTFTCRAKASGLSLRAKP